jgi:hypothetical protein
VRPRRPPKNTRPAVVGDVARVPLDDRGIFRFFDVQEDVPELNGPETHEQRAVWIAFFVGEGVVFSMHSDPFLRG